MTTALRVFRAAVFGALTVMEAVAGVQNASVTGFDRFPSHGTLPGWLYLFAACWFGVLTFGSLRRLYR